MYERPRVNLKIEQGSAFQQQQGRKIFTKQTDSNLLTTWLTVLQIRIQNPKK